MPQSIIQEEVERLILSQETSGRAAEAAARADEDFKIGICYAVERGLTTREIAQRLEVSRQVVSKWRIQGEEARARRLGKVVPDRLPEPSEELQPLG